MCCDIVLHGGLYCDALFYFVMWYVAQLLEQEKQEMQRLKKLLELREQRIGEIEKKLSALT